MSTQTTSSGNGERSAAEIEHEVERNRARLMNAAEELRERVSPGQLADQAVEWLRGSGGREFIGNVGVTIRDNPLPILLIGAGVAWLAFGGRSAASRRSSYASGPYDDLSDTTVPYGAGAPATGSSGPGIGERISGTASDLKERAEDLAAHAGETASEAWERTKAKAQALAGSVSGSARRATTWQGAGRWEAGGRTRRGIEEMLETQPLLMGALGLALGATLGALLPPTETEDRLLGEPRDRLAERVQGAASEVYERGKEKLSESGLTPAHGATVVSEVARDLRETVERTAEELTGATRRTSERGGTPGARPGGTA